MTSAKTHELFVDDWLTRVERAERLEPLRLLELAMAPLWKRASSTLGSVTLAAIVQRVRIIALEQYPALEGLDVTEQGVSLSRIPSTDATRTETQAAVRYFLVQFLTVIGTLTAEILTPVLHATLADVRGKNGARERKGSKR